MGDFRWTAFAADVAVGHAAAGVVGDVVADFFECRFVAKVFAP